LYFVNQVPNFKRPILGTLLSGTQRGDAGIRFSIFLFLTPTVHLVYSLGDLEAQILTLGDLNANQFQLLGSFGLLQYSVFKWIRTLPNGCFIMPTTLFDFAQYTLSQRSQRNEPQHEDSSVLKKKSKSSQRDVDHFKNFEPIDLPLKELRDAIPSHLFERSVWKSSLWLCHDMVLAIILFGLALNIDRLADWMSTEVTKPWVTMALWGGYWVAQGVVCTGIWVRFID
jgi:hypothetical protein